MYMYCLNFEVPFYKTIIENCFVIEIIYMYIQLNKMQKLQALHSQ